MKRHHPSIKTSVGLVIPTLLVLFLSSVAIAEAEDVSTLQGLIPLIQQQEQTIKNLHVGRFSMRTLARTSGEGDWKPAGFQISGAAWYTGKHDGKVRMNVVQTLQPYKGGGSLAQTQEDMGYDGQFGRHSVYQSGVTGKMKFAGYGMILPEPPALLRNRFYNYATGSLFALAYLREGGKSVSQMLNDALRAGVPVKISKAVFSGVDAIYVQSGDRKKSFSCYWFDPNKGYALRGIEKRLIFPDGTVNEWREVISKLAEIAPGVWYPLAAFRDEPGLDFNGQLRIEYHAEQITANDPHFSSDVFQVSFPSGYRIEDRVHHVKFVAGQ